MLTANGATTAILELPPAAIPLNTATPVARATPTTVRQAVTLGWLTTSIHGDATRRSGEAAARSEAPLPRRRPNSLLVTSTGGTGPLGERRRPSGRDGSVDHRLTGRLVDHALVVVRRRYTSRKYPSCR